MRRTYRQLGVLQLGVGLLRQRDAHVRPPLQLARPLLLQLADEPEDLQADADGQLALAEPLVGDADHVFAQGHDLVEELLVLLGELGSELHDHFLDERRPPARCR